MHQACAVNQACVVNLCNAAPIFLVRDTLVWYAGMQAELGFSIKGTTDAALVEQQCITAGLPATGLRRLWQLKRQLHGPTSGVLAAMLFSFIWSGTALPL